METWDLETLDLLRFLRVNSYWSAHTNVLVAGKSSGNDRHVSGCKVWNTDVVGLNSNAWNNGFRMGQYHSAKPRTLWQAKLSD